MFGSDCSLGPGFEVEAQVYLCFGAFFHRLHFLSKRIHSLQHGRLKDPHLVLQLDVELVTQGFFYFLSYFVKLYMGWVGQFEVSLKIQNVRYGGVEEMKISFQQHPQGLLEIQKMPPRHPPTSPDHYLRHITCIGHFLLSDISMPMLDFYKLFFSET